MKKVLTALLLTALATSPAIARGHSSSHHSSYSHRSYSYHPARARSYRPHHYAATSSGYYTNVDGNRVHRPMMSSSRPSGASAHCADGSWSFSQHARGTCSHHGGVASW